MTRPTEPLSAPLSLRLSKAERARLERDAAGQSMSAYVRARLFDGASTRRSRGQFPIKDHRALSQALALLGRSELSTSLAALAEAARLGSLSMDEETLAQLEAACAHISEIRALLMKALGLREP